MIPQGIEMLSWCPAGASQASWSWSWSAVPHGHDL